MKKLLRPYTPPSWAAGLNFIPKYRVPLARLPTPLEPFGQDSLDGVNLWVKKDEDTGFLTSGNKIRKLEFLLADAIDKGCDCVVTAGGIQSNHCRATAVAATQVGLKSYIVLRTDESPNDIGLEGNVLINRLVGAEIRLVSISTYRRLGPDAILANLAERLREEGHTPYVIPVGGSNEVGSWGYIEAVQEIITQAEAEGIVFDDIVVSTGSGGTAAGLGIGIALSSLKDTTKLHAFCACDNAEYFHKEIDGILQRMGGSAESLRAKDLLNVVEGYVGLGYAKSSEAELKFIIDIARKTGVVVDPVYSGKALYGLHMELQRHPEAWKGHKILFIHTGGGFGLFPKKPELAPLFDKDEVQQLIL